MKHEYSVVYKCRLCGDTYTERVCIGTKTDILRRLYECEWNAIETNSVHQCKNGAFGISDLQGVKPVTKRGAKMNLRLTLSYDLNSEKPDPTDRIQEILRRSYDYQHDGLDYATVVNGDATVQHNFYIYPEHCDQPKRTLETLRQIEDLIMSYI